MLHCGFFNQRWRIRGPVEAGSVFGVTYQVAADQLRSTAENPILILNNVLYSSVMVYNYTNINTLTPSEISYFRF